MFPDEVIANVERWWFGDQYSRFWSKIKILGLCPPNFDELATITDVVEEEGNSPPHARAADVTLEIRSADEGYQSAYKKGRTSS